MRFFQSDPSPVIQIEPLEREIFCQDGIENPRRRAQGRASRLPTVPLIQFALAFMAFRIVLCLHLGTTLYNARMETLAGGDLVAQFCALLMRLDPVSVEIVGVLRGTAGFPLF